MTSTSTGTGETVGTASRAGVAIVPSADLAEHPTLNGPFRRESDFSSRLGLLMSDQISGTSVTWLAGALKQALAESMTEPLSEEQLTLLHQRLHRVEPAVTAAPDIVLADEENRIVLVVETKGPRTHTQWTPLSSARYRRVADDVLAAPFIYAQAVELYDPIFDQPHEDGTPCGCRLQKDLGGGRHCNALHQGDCYVTFDDWVPEGYVRHPQAVFVALLPSPSSVWDWRQHLVSDEAWNVARVRTFHDLLAGDRPSTAVGYARARFTGWEHSLAHDLGTATHTYFELGTPSEYTDAEWETYGAPEDPVPFVPQQAAVDQFALWAWQDEPLGYSWYQCFLVLTTGRADDGRSWQGYLERHAEWRAGGGTGRDWEALAPAQEQAAQAAQGSGHQGPSQGAQMAKAAGMWLLKATAESIQEARAEKKAFRRARPRQPRGKATADAIAACILDDRQKWQKDADELRRLQLKAARKRNGAWW